MFETFYSFKGKKGELCEKLPGTIEGQPFALEDLASCEVRLLDHSDQVTVDVLKECQVFIGPSCESVFIRDCEDCVFTVACKQLRTRDCKRCIIFLYSKTEPVIETSSDLTFAPFNGSYPGLSEHFKAANLDPAVNLWQKIFDFNKDDQQSEEEPHYSLLPKENWEEWAVPIDNDENCENPCSPDLSVLPSGSEASSLGATTEHAIPELQAQQMSVDKASDGSVIQSFSIHTSAQDAQAAVDISVQKAAECKGTEIVRCNPVTRGNKIRTHQIVKYGGLVYMSGLVGNYQTSSDAAEQAVQILEKVDQLLEVNGSHKSRILSATVWLSDMRHVTQFNAVWDAWVDGEHAPARSCVEARLESPQCHIQVQIVAAELP